MEESGFEIIEEGDAVRGSFLKDFLFKSKEALSSDKAREIFEEGAEALRLKTLDLPTAEASLKLAEAASKLINSLEAFEAGVIRTGAVLVVKVTRNGKSYVKVDTVSPTLMHELNSDPSLLERPDDIFDLLINDVNGEMGRQLYKAKKQAAG